MQNLAHFSISAVFYFKLNTNHLQLHQTFNILNVGMHLGSHLHACGVNFTKNAPWLIVHIGRLSNSHSLAMKLMIFYQISWSHSAALKSHSFPPVGTSKKTLERLQKPTPIDKESLIVYNK